MLTCVTTWQKDKSYSLRWQKQEAVRLAEMLVTYVHKHLTQTLVNDNILRPAKSRHDSFFTFSFGFLHKCIVETNLPSHTFWQKLELMCTAAQHLWVNIWVWLVDNCNHWPEFFHQESFSPYVRKITKRWLKGQQSNLLKLKQWTYVVLDCGLRRLVSKHILCVVSASLVNCFHSSCNMHVHILFAIYSHAQTHILYPMLHIYIFNFQLNCTQFDR